MADFKFINLTPHAVTLVTADGKKEVFQPSGIVARVSQHEETVCKINDKFPLVKTVYGDVENLPKPEAGVLYIVSSLVLDMAKYRLDLVAPYGFIRNEAGQIVGCSAFRQGSFR